MNDMYRVRSKVWLEFDSHPFFGDGRYDLLAAVARTGSINAAAKDLGIAYRKAWARLDTMEERAPFPLLKRHTGGKGGGATELTSEARALLKNFEHLRNGVNAAANELFRQIF
ncbi:MAG: LysR family transcriptional regulator [Desulfuromonadaceae bacterium]